MHLQTIFISGVHAGPNTAAGVGIARSLRQAFPDCRLVAVGHSSLSSGLNWPDFSAFLVFPDWDVLDLSRHSATILQTVQGGVLWLSVDDREIHWLADALDPTPGLIAPSKVTLGHIAKPCLSAAELLGLRVPLSSSIDDERALHAFCRRSGWDVWVKGPVSDAARAASWMDLQSTIEGMAQKARGRDGVFVQQHVEGCGEAVAFCAVDGKLLGAVGMVKRDVTPIGGKTWTGGLSPISE